MALSNEPVTVICYGKEKQFNSRQEAYDYYKQGVLETDGSEQSRYATICTMLLSSNDKIVGDDEYYDTMAVFKEMTCKIVADYIKKNSNEYADTYSSEDDFTCNSYDKDDVDYEY